MNGVERQLAEDKALRDAALSVFQADLKFVKEDIAARSVGGRIADRLSDSTLDMVDDAVDYASSNKGRFAATFAAIVVWFARVPIIHALSDFLAREDEGEEQRADPERLDSEQILMETQDD